MADTTRLSLLAALKDSGNREAWEQFAERYGDLICQWCQRWCCGKGMPRADAADTAEEVAQQILATIHARMATFEIARHERGGYRRWLRRTVYHEAINYLKARSRQRGSGDSAVLDRLTQEPARVDLEKAVDDRTEGLLFQEVLQQMPGWVGADAWQITQELGLADGRTEKRLAGAGLGRLPAEEVARRHGLSVRSVLRIKKQVLQRLKDEMIRRLRERDREAGDEP